MSDRTGRPAHRFVRGPAAAPNTPRLGADRFRKSQVRGPLRTQIAFEPIKLDGRLSAAVAIASSFRE